MGPCRSPTSDRVRRGTSPPAGSIATRRWSGPSSWRSARQSSTTSSGCRTTTARGNQRAVTEPAPADWPWDQGPNVAAITVRGARGRPDPVRQPRRGRPRMAVPGRPIGGHRRGPAGFDGARGRPGSSRSRASTCHRAGSPGGTTPPRRGPASRTRAAPRRVESPVADVAPSRRSGAGCPARHDPTWAVRNHRAV